MLPGDLAGIAAAFLDQDPKGLGRPVELLALEVVSSISATIGSAIMLPIVEPITSGSADSRLSPKSVPVDQAASRRAGDGAGGAGEELADIFVERWDRSCAADRARRAAADARRRHSGPVELLLEPGGDPDALGDRACDRAPGRRR